MTRDELQRLKISADLKPYQARLKSFEECGAEYRACCLWHPDKSGSPSLAIYKGDDGSWQFKCMSRNCASGDVIAFIQKVDKLTFAEAVRKLANDTGVAQPAAPTHLGECTAEQIAEVQQYLLDHGVSLDVAKERKMEAVVHPKLGLAIAMPYDADPSVIKYRCVGKPISKGTKFSHASGHPSEDLLYNIHQTEHDMDKAWFGTSVYVVESERDCLTMNSQGFMAVSVSSASTCVDADGHLKIDDDQLQILARADEIFLALDQDPAGQKCADAFETDTNFTSVQMKRVTWPYGGKRSDDPKDIGDLYKQDPAGFKDKIEALSQEARLRPPKWRQQFSTIAELDTRPIVQLIEGFMTEGNISVGGLSGAGKTFLALSITKALTTGQPFVGRFRVPEKTPVLYLIPEVGDRQFYKRAKAFQIPVNDDSLFLCRTLSKGATLPLDHPDVLTAVRQLHGPVVVLDTAIRFSSSEDENSSAQNQWMEHSMRQLREAGCIAVIALHHSPKGSDREAPTLENTLRGSGDIGALMDIVYSIRTDRRIKDAGDGEQITVECVKPRDFDPPLPFNLGLKYKHEDGSMHSYIDEHHDLVSMAIDRPKTVAIDSFAAKERAREKRREDDEQAFLKLVDEDPTISKRALQAEMKVGHNTVTKVSERLGYAYEGGRWTPPPGRKDRQPVLVNASAADDGDAEG